MEGSGLHGVAPVAQPAVVQKPAHSATASSASFAGLALYPHGFADADDIQWHPAYVLLKRVADIIGALTIGLVFLPLIAIVVVALGQSGEIIFAHPRVGRAGRLFKVYKFRSMVADADHVLAQVLACDPDARVEWERDHKLRNDPRITPLGAFLRKTSLDELPQLWNVLRGDMSLVGPRPIIPAELGKYGRAARYYLAVKPGITGLWQVTGRSDTDYRRRVAIDRRYARTASLWVDLRVLLKTVLVVLSRRGAY